MHRTTRHVEPRSPAQWYRRLNDIGVPPIPRCRRLGRAPGVGCHRATKPPRTPPTTSRVRGATTPAHQARRTRLTSPSSAAQWGRPRLSRGCGHRHRRSRRPHPFGPCTEAQRGSRTRLLRSGVLPQRAIPVDAPATPTEPLSNSVQPSTPSATVHALSSPQFGRFASYPAPENRGVGSSILPVTTTLVSGSRIPCEPATAH